MSSRFVLLKGGRVIDPAFELDQEPCDVLLDGKKVLKVGKGIQLPDGGQVFDASGCLVCPGLVDLHVHCFPGGTLLGVDPDEWCLKRGVTTVVDAGSAGTVDQEYYTPECCGRLASLAKPPWASAALSIQESAKRCGGSGMACETRCSPGTNLIGLFQYIRMHPHGGVTFGFPPRKLII